MNAQQESQEGESEVDGQVDQDLLHGLLKNLGQGAEGPPLSEAEFQMLSAYARSEVAAHSNDAPLELGLQQILDIQLKILQYRAWADAYAQICRQDE